MTNRADVQAALDALTAKEGTTNTVSPANLVSDQLEVMLNNSAMVDEAVKNNQVIVKTASQLTGVIDSTKEYFIDGVIDLTSVGSIEVPVGGINLKGYDFNTSKLICSDAAYTMFTSPVGGSGDVLGMDYAIEVTGAGSQVYDIESATGFNAFEFARINYNNCSSLGTITAYRQGLEIGTGRFGGQPSLTLEGPWVGGYRITTSIVRGIDNAMTAPLFKAGGGFTMASRFLTDINADLGTLAPLTDFAPANFPNPSTFQIVGAIVSRGGVISADDATTNPNIQASDLACAWKGNVGIKNTFVGGTQSVSAEIETAVSAIGTYYDLAGTWTPTDLQHFSAPVNGRLQHDGNSPREYRIVCDLVVDGPSNDEVAVKVVKWDASASSFSDVIIQRRQINNLSGGRDVGFYNIYSGMALDQGDYIKLQVANLTSTGNVTVENDSFFTILER